MPHGAGISWLRLQQRLESGSRYVLGGSLDAAPSLELIKRRLLAVQRANIEGQRLAASRLGQRFADIDIGEVLSSLLGEVQELARYMVIAALSGGAIGAIGGAFSGGVGAVPGFMGGAALGMRTAGTALGLFGLLELSKELSEQLPRISGLYAKAAWRAYNSITEGPTTVASLPPAAWNSAWPMKKRQYCY